MRQTKRIILLSLLLILQQGFLFAAGGRWHSPLLGSDISYTLSEPKKPARDVEGKVMTVVYLENLACEKIGQVSNRKNVGWLLRHGYRVIELDYRGDKRSVSPGINTDIRAINKEMAKGSFCAATDISVSRAYVLFEGYRIHRDVAYSKDDPAVYNYPADYACKEGDSLYMDIIYPEEPRHAVTTILSFSYSNSYAGTANGGYTDAYRHRRMYLPYTLSMFDDTILEGAPAAGMAWAIADHPKYCDWGRGNSPGGPQKEYGAVEIASDAACKVRNAIRTLRGFCKNIGFGGAVAVYGFSRGSTAASLAIGDTPFPSWQEDSLCSPLFVKEPADIQAAILGPGIFNYGIMPSTTNEYKHIAAYARYAVAQGLAETEDEVWREQGGALAVSGRGTAPTLLFYNTDDARVSASDAKGIYAQQAEYLMNLFGKKGVTHEVITDYGSGHTIPQDGRHLRLIYEFIKNNVKQ